MPRQTSLVTVLCVAGLLGGLLPLAAPAPPARAAATFTVTTTGDGGDDTPDGACDANPSRAVVECTLREAIQEANFTPGDDIIAFDIFEAVGGDLKTIRPNSPLPGITDTVTIDGYTQPGARHNTAAVGTNAVLKIELDGTNAGAEASGLRIFAPNTQVHGLVINGFAEAGIVVSDGTEVVIAGCFIGTDATGTRHRGNGRGVYIVHGSFTLIGGTFPGNRNLISGNRIDGILLSSLATDNRIQGNLIGTDATGKGPLGNGGGTAGVIGYGIVVLANNTLIGGDRAAAANTIAFNGSGGVAVGDETSTFSPRSNSILRNAIFANEYGIDLLVRTQGGVGASRGPTPNDLRDRDTGPNELQNKPELTKATTTGGTTTVSGHLNSTPNRSFLLQFFANPPGGDEGQTFLGQLSVTTNRNGDASFDFTPPRRVGRVGEGKTITATATDPRGNASEFSPPRTVRSPGAIGR